jgi:hypothetical protein
LSLGRRSTRMSSPVGVPMVSRRVIEGSLPSFLRRFPKKILAKRGGKGGDRGHGVPFRGEKRQEENLSSRCHGHFTRNEEDSIVVKAL